LYSKGQNESHWYETEGVSAGGVEIRVDAFGKGTLPEKRKDEPGDGKCGEIAESFGAYQELWREGGLRRRGNGMSEGKQEELADEEKTPSDGKEEKCMAEVRDASGRIGRRDAIGRLEEECGLVFGTGGWAEDGHGNGRFL
jgi:hypothetical protein